MGLHTEGILIKERGIDGEKEAFCRGIPSVDPMLLLVDQNAL